MKIIVRDEETGSVVGEYFSLEAATRVLADGFSVGKTWTVIVTNMA
jgi:hypothetical protein